MPSFSNTNKARLDSCHVDLRILFNTVIQKTDCWILCGHRGKAAQDLAYENGFSKLKFPQSKNNKAQSLAVDVAPYFVQIGAIDWEDIKAFCYFAGRVMETADKLHAQGAITHRVRWGGDWNMNGRVDGDEVFIDCPHFELID